MNKLIRFCKVLAVIILCSWILSTPFGHKAVFAAAKLTLGLASGIWGATSALIG